MNVQTAEQRSQTAPIRAGADNPLPRLILVERQARKAESTDHLGFIAVNETHRVVSYYQGLLWCRHAVGGVKIQNVSGVSQVDQQSPAMMALTKLVKLLSIADSAGSLCSLTMADVPDKLREDWQEWLPEHALWCPFPGPVGLPEAGLLFTREQPFTDAETALLEPLVEAYGHAWAALRGARGRRGRAVWDRFRSRPLRWLLAAVLLGSMAVPVRESVLAPSEVVPSDPIVVTAPIRGVIKAFHVRPNEKVEKGQLLFTFDDTEIRSRYDMAVKGLAVARADHLRAAQKAFSDPRSKAELESYKAQVEEKALEHDYVAALLERTKVPAERSGIAVFADANDWVGKPVSVGQKIVVLADPTQTELQVWVAAEDAINLELGAEVLLFLNTDPTAPREARVTQTSYEPDTMPTGNVAFRLRAQFGETGNRPRVGLQGTAKVYGDKVPLIYYLMRRPLSAARQTIGW